MANCNLQPNWKGLNLVPTLLSADGKLIFLFAHREENVLRECHRLIFTLSRKLFEMPDGFGGKKLRNVFLSLWQRCFLFGTTVFFTLEYFSRRGYKDYPKKVKMKEHFSRPRLTSKMF
jgi:hypothetical protein